MPRLEVLCRSGVSSIGASSANSGILHFAVGKSDALCVLQEVRRVWIGYLSQCDARLGQNIAQKLQAKGAL